MGGSNVAIRILGVASTTRGFGYAVMEGPDRLVDLGSKRTTKAKAVNIEAVDAVLQRARPLFVAFDRESSSKKGRRGRLFVGILRAACAAHEIMIVDVDNERLKALTNTPNPSKWEVAEALARRFPEAAHRLPARRKPWQGEDDRVGMFLALAAATVTWAGFRPGR